MPGPLIDTKHLLLIGGRQWSITARTREEKLGAIVETTPTITLFVFEDDGTTLKLPINAVLISWESRILTRIRASLKGPVHP